MNTPHPNRALLALVALALTTLVACGGGGSSSSSASPSPEGATPATPATLSGVAAVGAPLGGAALSVIDAQGRLVGSTRTNTTDGSYTLQLDTATPKLPLMLQAAGHDATGRPLLLHSALSELPTRALAHLTPLTDAAVALTLGTDPAAVFAQPTDHAAPLAGLAKVGLAADFVRTLVKANLTDTKLAGVATVNLLSASGFTADKTGVDLALETLDVTIGSSPAGAAQLQLANKLGAATSEVTVDLAAASAEIAKTGGGAPASAITSTLKATTSPAALMPRLATLDTLQVAINAAIASGGGASATAALTAAYTRHNGRSASDLAALIASWAARSMQMGRLQVTGCADATVAAGGCAKVAVAARLIDASGAQNGSFSDVVSYDSRALSWLLVGNNHPAQATARAVAWWSLDAGGTPLTGAAAHPQLGVQLAVGASGGNARVQLPGGHVLALVPCEQPWLCVSVTAGATVALATGALSDHAVFQPGSAWLGTADIATGARYSYTLTSADGAVTTQTARLRRAFPAAPPAGRFPVLDEVSSARPLASAALLAGRTLGWQAWATANPDMRLLSVRLVLAGASASGAAWVIEAAPDHWQATTLDWAGTTVPETHAGSPVTLWLVAVDSAGRLYATRYGDLPVN